MKQIIWSNDSRIDDEAREYYQNFQREQLEDDCYMVSDEEWGEEVNSWLDDERFNLNKEVDGVIIAFGDLGFWYGRRQGYQILAATLPTSCIAPVKIVNGTATVTTSVDVWRTTTVRTMCFTGWRKAERKLSG